ncbi:DUF547 domain-containing protein [Maribacter algicola]|uniref:DUF547 domain-containing protein n=1 Tax=Meishania litoralis TaxID=3434685 RepID=A0ACC7LQL2_9FLAO
MQTIGLKLNRLICVFLLITLNSNAQSTSKELDLNELSEAFLVNIKNGASTNEIREKIYGLSLEDIVNGLSTDDKKLAFWVNVYNAYIQVILSENPKLYDDKRSFFKKEQLPIAGRMISFEKIEHGIIRKSQWPLGLGFVRKWFPDRFERKLRVDKRDHRVHFALNCGAKDCPPVAIYEAPRLDDQFDRGTELYLKRTSKYNAENNEVAVTSLFNWFRGDFGCKKGIKKILKRQEIIPTTKRIDITYQNYDWTLDLDNWIEL